MRENLPWLTERQSHKPFSVVVSFPATQVASLYAEWRESGQGVLSGSQHGGGGVSADQSTGPSADMVRLWRETVQAERARAAAQARAEAAAEMSVVKISKDELEQQNRRMQLEVTAFRSALIRNHLANAAIRTATVTSDAAVLLEAAANRGVGFSAPGANEGKEEVVEREVILAMKEQLDSVQQDLQSERLRMKLLLRSGAFAMAEAEEEGEAASAKTGKGAKGAAGKKGSKPKDPLDLSVNPDDPDSKDRALVAALQAVAEARQESADLADGAQTGTGSGQTRVVPNILLKSLVASSSPPLSPPLPRSCGDVPGAGRGGRAAVPGARRGAGVRSSGPVRAARGQAARALPEAAEGPLGGARAVPEGGEEQQQADRGSHRPEARAARCPFPSPAFRLLASPGRVSVSLWAVLMREGNLLWRPRRDHAMMAAKRAKRAMGAAAASPSSGTATPTGPWEAPGVRPEDLQAAWSSQEEATAAGGRGAGGTPLGGRVGSGGLSVVMEGRRTSDRSAGDGGNASVTGGAAFLFGTPPPPQPGAAPAATPGLTSLLRQPSGGGSSDGIRRLSESNKNRRISFGTGSDVAGAGPGSRSGSGRQGGDSEARKAYAALLLLSRLRHRALFLLSRAAAVVWN